MPNPPESTVTHHAGHSEDERRAGETTGQKLRREADEAASAVRDEGSKLKDDLKTGARSEAESLKQEAGAEVSHRRFDAAAQVDAFASALRAGVESLESDGHGAMADYWRSAADGAGRLAERIRHKPLADAWRDTEEYVREEPTLSFGGAMVAGFMIARFLKSSTPEDTEQRLSAGTGGRSSQTAGTEPGASWPAATAHEPAAARPAASSTERGSSWPPGTAREPGHTAAVTTATDRPQA
jgi:hypothetical protein